MPFDVKPFAVMLSRRMSEVAEGWLLSGVAMSLVDGGLGSFRGMAGTILGLLAALEAAMADTGSRNCDGGAAPKIIV